MAERLESGKDLAPPHYLRPSPVRRLREAVLSARDIDPKEYPVKHRRGDGPRLEIDEAKLDSIRRFRDQVAADLGIEATVVATRIAMERLAATNLPEEEKQGLLLDWQRTLLAPCL